MDRHTHEAEDRGIPSISELVKEEQGINNSVADDEMDHGSADAIVGGYAIVSEESNNSHENEEPSAEGYAAKIREEHNRIAALFRAVQAAQVIDTAGHLSNTPRDRPLLGSPQRSAERAIARCRTPSATSTPRSGANSTIHSPVQPNHLRTNSNPSPFGIQWTEQQGATSTSGGSMVFGSSEDDERPAAKRRRRS